MAGYKARTFIDGQVFYASDVNIIEKQLELLTNKLNALSSLSNIWIDVEPPEDKTMLWIDLSDNVSGISSEVNSILNSYTESISYLTEEINKLKEIINSGGLIIPDDNNNYDTNNYFLLEDGLMLLAEDGVPILCENDFNNINIQISNAILGEDNLPIICEDNSVLLLQ